MTNSILKKSEISAGSFPRWMIFIIDIGIVFVMTLIAFLIRFEFNIPLEEYQAGKISLLVILFLRGVAFFSTKTFKGIIRYTNSQDAIRITSILLLTSLGFAIVNAISYFFFQKFIIPFSIIIIEFLLTAFCLLLFRILVKYFFDSIKVHNRSKKRIAIYGAGNTGIMTKRALDNDSKIDFQVLQFFEDNVKKNNKRILGKEIKSTTKLDAFLSSNDVNQFIIASEEISQEKLREISDTCLNHNVDILHVPPFTQWVNGQISSKQIKSLRIEDLLGRNPIQLNTDKLHHKLKNKHILISGAAGSIGSELVRQILLYNPSRVYLLDIAESALYDLLFELSCEHKDKIEPIIGDIRSKKRLENIFKTFNIDIVFHAAAYKHVPLMENNPTEAIKTNVEGTLNLANYANKYKCTHFIMVSTDKAVNPTNVMGASKRIAEIYVQSLNEISETQYITTRFGNVLGSNGSVIPLFKKQIENGGPITVTHPEITRFFMTIPEACQLVLEAATIGNGGEIYVFDMGESIKIVDLAKKMIQLSGYRVNEDINIVFSGLRPGEKLFEELLSNEENTLPTSHPQILIAKVISKKFLVIEKEIKELVALYDLQNNEKIVQQMKIIVPEFISNNSIYQKLDQSN